MFSLFFLRILINRNYRFLDNNALFHALAFVNRTLYFLKYTFPVSLQEQKWNIGRNGRNIIISKNMQTQTCIFVVLLKYVTDFWGEWGSVVWSKIRSHSLSFWYDCLPSPCPPSTGLRLTQFRVLEKLMDTMNNHEIMIELASI